MSAGPSTPHSEGACTVGQDSSFAVASSPPMTPKGGPRSFKKYKPSKLSITPMRPGQPPSGTAPGGVIITEGRLEVGDFEVSRDGAVSKKVWLLVNDPQFSGSFNGGVGPLAASPVIYSDAPFEQRRKALAGRILYDDLIDDGGFLGKGNSSSVRRVLYRPTERQFALKEIKIYDPSDTNKFCGKSVDHQLETVLLRELQMLHANHCNDHIVKYYDAYYMEGYLRITLEYMHHGSVANITQKRGKWPERPLVSVAEQVMQGLLFIHSVNKIHRDIKPSNLLVNRKGVVKISDFGIAMVGDNDGEVADPGGSLPYMSPERHNRMRHGSSADVWALGVTLAECALGQYPYDLSGVSGPWDLVRVISEELAFPAHLSVDPEFLNLIRTCSIPEPAASRPSAQQFVESSYMKTYRRNSHPHADILAFVSPPEAAENARSLVR